MSSFIKFMEDRQRLIERGHLGYDRVQMVNHPNHADEKQFATRHMVASDQQRANKSDPFIYERTVSHLRNGTSMPSDYHIVWGRGEAVSPIGLALGKEVKIAIMVPHKRQVPCN